MADIYSDYGLRSRRKTRAGSSSRLSSDATPNTYPALRARTTTPNTTTNYPTTYYPTTNENGLMARRLGLEEDERNRQERINEQRSYTKSAVETAETANKVSNVYDYYSAPKTSYTPQASNYGVTGSQPGVQSNLSLSQPSNYNNYNLSLRTSNPSYNTQYQNLDTGSNLNTNSQTPATTSTATTTSSPVKGGGVGDFAGGYVQGYNSPAQQYATDDYFRQSQMGGRGSKSNDWTWKNDWKMGAWQGSGGGSAATHNTTQTPNTVAGFIGMGVGGGVRSGVQYAQLKKEETGDEDWLSKVLIDLDESISDWF